MKLNSPDIIDYDKNIAALKEVQPAAGKGFGNRGESRNELDRQRTV